MDVLKQIETPDHVFIYLHGILVWKYWKRQGYGRCMYAPWQVCY